MSDRSVEIAPAPEEGSLLPWYQRTVRAEAEEWLTRRRRHLGVTQRARPVETYLHRLLDDFWRQLFGDKPGKVLAKLFPIWLTLYLVYAVGRQERDLSRFGTSLAQHMGTHVCGGIVGATFAYLARERRRSQAWGEELKVKVGRLEAAIAIWDETQQPSSAVDPLTRRWVLVELEQAVEAAKRGPAA